MKKLIILILFIFFLIILSVLVYAPTYYKLSDGFDVSADGSTTPYGVAFDPTDNTFWVMDDGDDYIYHFNSAGTELGDGFSIAADYNQMGLAYDTSDNTLWIGTTSSVKHYNKAGTDLGDGFDFPSGCTISITYDSVKDTIMTIKGTNDGICNISMAGSLISSFSTSGFGADNLNSLTTNGTHIYAVDTTDEFVYNMDMNGNNYTDGFSISGKGIGAPRGITIDKRNNNSWWIIDVVDDFLYKIGTDTEYPSWKLNRTNFTLIKTNQHGQFNITVEDNSEELDSIILSFKNQTSNWENISKQTLSGSSNDVTFEITLSTKRDEIQYWKFYIKDSAGNMNETDLFQINVSDTVPTIPNTPTITTDGVLGNYTNVTITTSAGAGSTDADADSITYYYRWLDTDDSTVLQEGTGTTFDCGSISGCDRGDTINIKVIATTVYGNSSLSSAGQTVIQDLAPYFNQNITNDSLVEDAPQTAHTDITGFCTDIDSDAITYSEVSTTPSNSVTVTIDGNDVLQHTPVANWNGTATTIIKCTANSLDNVFGNSKYWISVSPVDDPPSTPSTPVITVATYYTNDILNMSSNGTDSTDPEADAITYYFRWLDSDGTTVLQENTSEIFKCSTSGCNRADTISVKTIATTALANSTSSASSTTTIADTSPIWATTINDDTIDEDSGINNHQDITGFCTDADSDAITYSVQTEDTSKVDIAITGADLITETPFPNWNGTNDVTIRCTANAITTDDTYTITVNSIQDYGLWSNNGTNFTSIKFADFGLFNVTFEDEDTIAGCLFSYNNDSQGWVNDTWVSKSGNITDLTTKKKMTGKYLDIYEWRYYCNDTETIMYNSSINSIIITDTPPVFDQTILDYTKLHNNSLSVQVNGTDFEGHPITYKVNDSIITISSSGLITDSWVATQNGTYNILVSLDSNISNATDIFKLTITETPPQFTQLMPDITYAHNSSINWTINATDGESDSITFKINDTILNMLNTTTGNLSGIPREMNTSYNFLISLDDGYYNNTDTFTLIVTNSKPTFDQALNDASINHHLDFNYLVNCTDSESDPIYYFDNSSLFNINSTGGINDNPSQNEENDYNILITCGDSKENNTDSFIYSIVNDAPSVSSVSINESSPIQTDQLRCENSSLSDTEGDTITLYYDWEKDSVLQGINSRDLASGNISSFENWRCSITPYDGFENGTTIYSSSVSIGTGFLTPSINNTNATTTTTSIISNSTNPTNNNSWINLSLTFQDANPNELHTIYFCYDSKPSLTGCLGKQYCKSANNITSNHTSCRFDLTNETGEQTYYVFILDNTSQLSSSSSNTFEVNNQPNIPFLISPINNNYTKFNYINLSFTGTDPNSDSLTFHILYQNGTEILNTTNTFYNLTNLDDQTIYWMIMTEDIHNYNSSYNSTIRNFTIDTTYPIITISSPTQGSSYSSQIITITNSINELNPDICFYSIKKTSTGVWESGNLTGYGDNITLPCGQTKNHNLAAYADWTFYGYVKDLAGNVNSSGAINFSTSAPTSSSEGGGGGGGSSVAVESIVKEVIGEVCGNEICGETESPFTCPEDCVIDLAILLEQAWFVRYASFALFGFFLYSTFIRKKRRK